MEFEKNAKTQGKNICQLKKMLRCDTFFNNFMAGICLNFVMEKIDFVMDNSWKKIHTVE